MNHIQICCWLRPQDLIALSRVDKQLHESLTTEKFRISLKNAREDVEGVSKRSEDKNNDERRVSNVRWESYVVFSSQHRVLSLTIQHHRTYQRLAELGWTNELLLLDENSQHELQSIGAGDALQDIRAMQPVEEWGKRDLHSYSNKKRLTIVL